MGSQFVSFSLLFAFNTISPRTIYTHHNENPHTTNLGEIMTKLITLALAYNRERKLMNAVSKNLKLNGLI
jgi:hypothetical protein